jgi:putative FmdB family regulatory protein
MPIYEYVCEACGQEFEKMVRFSEADLAPKCPTCGSDETHKQISRVASGFGGSGNDFSSSSSCSGGGRFT